MKHVALLTIGLAVLLASSASADTPAKSDKAAPVAAKPAKAIKPMELTCEEFLSYDEVTRPQIVYWSEGLNGKGKPDSAVIDVERTNSLVPVLVEDCRQEPKTSYWTKLKQEFKKTF
jgi:acid stress chaperone HdeA